MAKRGASRWADRLRWAVMGALVLGAPAIGLWVFLDAFPRLRSASKSPQVLSDEDWLKVRRQMNVSDLWSRPRALRGRILFDHDGAYWLTCRDAEPAVTAVVRGDYSRAELIDIARYGATLAFLTFRGAKRSLVLHLWCESEGDGGASEIRHCVAPFEATLSNPEGRVNYKVTCDPVVHPSVFTRGVTAAIR